MDRADCLVAESALGDVVLAMRGTVEDIIKVVHVHMHMHEFYQTDAISDFAFWDMVQHKKKIGDLI